MKSARKLFGLLTADNSKPTTAIWSFTVCQTVPPWLDFRLRMSFSISLNYTVLPGLSVTANQFWTGLAEITHELGPKKPTLCWQSAKKCRLKLISWHIDNRGREHDPAKYQGFLSDIGYLVAEPNDFRSRHKMWILKLRRFRAAVGCPNYERALCIERRKRALGQPL